MILYLLLYIFDEGADAEQLAASTDLLRKDLIELDPGDVMAEPGTRAQATSHSGHPAPPGLMIYVRESGGRLRSVLSVIRTWLRGSGSPGRTIRLEADGGDALVLAWASSTDQDERIEAFLSRYPDDAERYIDTYGSLSAPSVPWGYRGLELGDPAIQSESLPGDGTAPAPADAASTPDVVVNVAADIPPQIQVGKTVSVACHISREEIDAAAGRARDQGQIRADETRLITVEVLPRANVEVVGEDRAELPVPGDGTTSDAYFDVRATHAGTCQVWIVARQGPVPLLTLRLEAAVTLKLPAGPGTRYPATARVVTGEQTGLEDVTWLSVVEMDRGQDTVYRFDLRSVPLGILATFESPPLRHRAEYVAGLYREIENRWLTTAGDVEAFQEELREFGGSLLSQLFPQQLQDILWRCRDSLKDMMVLSSEPFIPWELVHLKEPGSPLPDETRFLAQTGLVRWLYTRDNGYPPQTLYARPGQVRVLCPDYPDPRLHLPQTRSEAQFLIDALGATAVVPHDRQVRALLRDGNFDVLHFAGHGLADSDDIANAKILLEGRRENGTYITSSLSATTVDQQARLTHADGSKPMIVLNACQAGRMGEQMSSLGGFAQAFLDRGAGAFISSMWSVGDQPASTFVKTLYTELLHQQPISAAASKARQEARRAGDGTWLAYAVYAHPQARIQVPG